MKIAKQATWIGALIMMVGAVLPWGKYITGFTEEAGYRLEWTSGLLRLPAMLTVLLALVVMGLRWLSDERTLIRPLAQGGIGLVAALLAAFNWVLLATQGSGGAQQVGFGQIVVIAGAALIVARSAFDVQVQRGESGRVDEARLEARLEAADAADEHEKLKALVIARGLTVCPDCGAPTHLAYAPQGQSRLYCTTCNWKKIEFTGGVES